MCFIQRNWGRCKNSDGRPMLAMSGAWPLTRASGNGLRAVRLNPTLKLASLRPSREHKERQLMMKDACDSTPGHPGPLIKVKLDELGVSKSKLAKLLRISRQTLYDLTAGKQCLTPLMALRVAKLTATSAKMWLDVQQAHDLARARINDAQLLAKVPVLNERW